MKAAQPAPSLVWFRNDLRLSDNPALMAASMEGRPAIPVFVWAPEEERPWPPGAASRWWLHQSLSRLDASLHSIGSKLIIRKGPTSQALLRLVEETQASAIFWNRRYEPSVADRDNAVKAMMQQHGLIVQTFNSALLFEPWDIQSQSGKPYVVFSPFWRSCLATPCAHETHAPPKFMASPSHWPSSLPLSKLQLEPSIDWAAGLRKTWRPGETGAHDRLSRFLEEVVTQYPEAREIPAEMGSSRLSPHLHFGEISPHRIWLKVGQAASTVPEARPGAQSYLRELGWREFAYHLLYHFPQTTDHPLRTQFAGMPWRSDPSAFKAWTRGLTGYPLVDAGMNELWTTGWMHNRVRMVVASFLTKHLMMNWVDGAAWFWDTLVDADLASNTLGWQWTSGCGADAAPYFRIFNPTLQGRKFDPDGRYVKRWLPMLRHLPSRWIHEPFAAPRQVLRESDVKLGEHYPAPLVEHQTARKRALKAYASLKE